MKGGRAGRVLFYVPKDVGCVYVVFFFAEVFDLAGYDLVLVPCMMDLMAVALGVSLFELSLLSIGFFVIHSVVSDLLFGFSR
ncbi:hypothetical protein IIU_06833 [Bacillus cereus VD133]|uniref:Transmembrane protein n=1 Tax=Bacillus cereus VD133 TaxID=1053233 RepID=A0A9W5UYX7_BACCE|nr:hypothetical protein [Bacillus cereus]EOO24105.1 hypothetical protein IIU_06833 [Bacillus cereus VD133]